MEDQEAIKGLNKEAAINAVAQIERLYKKLQEAGYTANNMSQVVTPDIVDNKLTTTIQLKLNSEVIAEIVATDPRPLNEVKAEAELKKAAAVNLSTDMDAVLELVATKNKK